MVEMPDEVYEALTDFYTLKMVASVNSSGMPNAVMIATTSALDKSTVCFADLRLGKTKSNILETKKFTVNVLKLTLESYQIKCSFNSYQERSKVADQYCEQIYQKIKLQPKGIIVGKVEEVYCTSLSNAGTKLA